MVLSLEEYYCLKLQLFLYSRSPGTILLHISLIIGYDSLFYSNTDKSCSSY